MAKKIKERTDQAAAGENEEVMTGKAPSAGMCRFCGQYQAVIGAERCETQEEIDQIATEECNCEEGRNWRERQTSMRAAEDQLAELFIDKQEHEAADNFLKPAIREIGRNGIKSLSIQISETVSASIHMNSKGNIIIKRKEQEIDMVAV